MAVRTVLTLLVAGIIQSGFSQAITFNTPLPWVSLRNDTITIRAQIDTATLKGKKLSLKLMKVKNGRAGTIKSKVFPIKDPAGEFSFGKINKSLIGGEEFLQVKWSVKGTKEKEEGTLEPIGIADLSALKNSSTVNAVKVNEGIALNAVAGKIGNAFQQTGPASYAVAWNKKALFIALKKSDGKEKVQFAFDGKSGKNAFLSYPDRIVSCTMADSIPVKGIHFERRIKKDSLVYKELNWQNEITHEMVDDKLIVRIPWFDTGMIPFEERTIGFGAFVTNEKGKTTGAFPEKAQQFIPATWGVLLLQK
jgi:hypothetical protein